MKNIMSVDLEDYFCDLDYTRWHEFKPRVEENTQILLELFNGIIILGYIAKKHPELIKQIKSEEHELATHGYYHKDLRKIAPDEFEDDLIKSIKTIENISKSKVMGFRAPFFSINKQTLWALKIIRKYLKYDSSIFPVRTPLYGISNAPRTIYNPEFENPLRHNENEPFFEIPPSTHHIPLIGNIPIAGGFHMRFWPLKYIMYGLRALNRKYSTIVFYIHPIDFDQDMPKISEYAWHYYFGLHC
jgi:polysaccharide deacetylase family protein (PEP-CTERM system associated)